MFQFIAQPCQNRDSRRIPARRSRHIFPSDSDSDSMDSTFWPHGLLSQFQIQEVSLAKSQVLHFEEESLAQYGQFLDDF